MPRCPIRSALLLLLVLAGAPSAAAEPGPPGVRLRDGVPVEAVVSRDEGPWVARIEVPESATFLAVALFGDRDVDLFLRHGQPPSGDPAASADAVAMSPAAREILTLSPHSDVRLRPGTWYVSVQNAHPRGGTASFGLVAFVDEGDLERTVLPGRPVLATVHDTGPGVGFRLFLPAAAARAVLEFDGGGEEGRVRYALEGPREFARAGSLGEPLVVDREDGGAPPGHYVLRLAAEAGGGSVGLTARATWVFADGEALPARPDPLLEPGDPLVFRLGGADHGEVRRFRIPVVEGSGGFVLEATNPSGADVDLYVSRDALPQDDLAADWLAFSTGTSERLVVAGDRPLPGGIYHGGVILNQDARPVDVTLTVRLLDRPAGPFTWGPADPPLLVPQSWVVGRIRLEASAIAWHAIEVPAGTGGLTAQLLDASSPLELLLARRSDGAVQWRATSPLVNERLQVTFPAPLAAPGRYLLGVLNREGWEDAEVQYRLAVGYDRPPRLPSDLAWPPVLAREAPTLVERIAAAAVEITIGDSSGGSGVFVSPRGLVLTCMHCLQCATAAPVQRSDVIVALTRHVDEPAVQAFYARVWAEYADLDLVLLELAGDVFGRPLPADLSLPWVPIGDFDAVRLGEPLWVAGYPQEGSERLRTPVIVTSGVVAGLERRRGRPVWLKTDAWIAPGHSGGPMLDAAGRLVGISAATLGRTESLGLGVPVSRIPPEWKARIARDLR